MERDDSATNPNLTQALPRREEQVEGGGWDRVLSFHLHLETPPRKKTASQRKGSKLFFIREPES